MPRRRMMDYLAMRDGRNPYGSRGGYVSSRRMRRMRDRGMDYGHYNEYDGVHDGERRAMDGNYPHSQYEDERGGRDYEHYGQHDMARRRDGHYPMNEGKTYYPIEAMGTFNGYWGTPEQDYGRMRGRRDYGYEVGYDYAGDYGESLTKEELEHWNKKMLKDVDERYKQHFKKETIAQKAKTMGIAMDGFTEDELLTATIAMYTDYCDVLKPYVGESMDIYVKMAKAFLTDKDASVKGGEKLAVYYDCIVEGEDD